MKFVTESIENLESLCEERPGSLAFARLASLYLDRGEVDQAVRVCIEGLKRYPNYTSARLVLGRCYERKGRWVEAATEFHRVCRIDHRNRAALKHLANALTHLQQTPLAGRIYAYLLKCDPDNAELRQWATATPGQEPQDMHQFLLDILPQAGPAASPAAGSPYGGTTAPQAPAQPVSLRSEPESGAAVRAATVPAPAPQQPSPEVHSPAEVKAFTDLIENAETIALAPSAPAASADISGQDISYRIDSLFGADEKSVQGPAEKAAAPLHDQDALTALFAAGQPSDSSSLDTGRFRMDEIGTDLAPERTGADAEADSDAFGATMAFDSPLLTDETVTAPPETGESEPPLPQPQVTDQLSFMRTAEADQSAGPSGTDVSSRLEEIFDFEEALEHETETAGAPTPAEETAAPDEMPLEGVRSEHIESAAGETVTFFDEIAAESDKTAVLSPEEQTALLAPNTMGEPPQESVAVEPAAESAADQTDNLPTSLLTDRLSGAETSSAQMHDAAAVADEILQAPADETAALALDQEMVFEGADVQPQEIADVVTAAFDGPPSEIVEELALPGVPGETPPEHSVQTRLDADTPTVSAPSAPASEEDIFAQTWLAEAESGEATSAAEPQTLEERAEEAQTLAFARDELDDLVAISSQHEQADKLADTTTIKSPAELSDEPQGPALETAFQAPGASVTFDDQTAEIGFQEIRLEKPAGPTPPTRPDTHIVSSDTSRLSQESLSGRTEQYPRVQQSAAQPENPFEAYAQEISQAQTIAFRRQELNLAGLEVSAEEQAELTEQVSRAQTVEFDRDQLRRLRGERLPAPDAAAAEEPQTGGPGIFDTGVDTAAVFLDEINAATVEMEAPGAGAEKTPAETARSGAVFDVPITDPFLAETFEPESTVTSQEHGLAETQTDSESAARGDTQRPVLPETVVMDRSDILPMVNLLWEEGPSEQTTGVDSRDEHGRARGDLADTVVMSGETPSALERTERMESLSDEPTVQEHENQLASIPDHVLTPTLADIYFRQGQPKLAIRIYQRLLQMHPENTRLSARIAEIEASMAANQQAAAPPAEPAAPTRVRLHKGDRKSRSRPPRPLAGVRIKKTYREQYARKKRTRARRA